MNGNDLFSAGRPIYIQLYEKLRKEITDGIYPFGSRFPSKRILAERYGISLVTAEHALSLLSDEGYIEPRERSGFFVVFREEDLFLPETESISPLPNAGSAGTGSFPFASYARTMRRVISEYGERILERSPNKGILPLRQAISSYLARSRWIRVSADRIIIGSGAEYLYGLIIQLFGRNRSYAIEQPSYEKIEMVYRVNGASVELLPLGKHGIHSSALNNSRSDILHITPYRSYPSGISTTASKRHEYIRWADSRSGYIIEDDYESEFSPASKPEETVFSLAGNDNVLYLNSFSRTIAPSIRIGYMILPEKLNDDFDRKLGFYSCSVPSFEQYFLTEFINSGEFERHLNRVRRKLRKA